MCFKVPWPITGAAVNTINPQLKMALVCSVPLCSRQWWQPLALVLELSWRLVWMYLFHILSIMSQDPVPIQVLNGEARSSTGKHAAIPPLLTSIALINFAIPYVLQH